MEFDHRMQGAQLAANPVAAKPNEATRQPAAKDGEKPENEAIARIREIGFRAYVEELNEKKIEELREKILQAMGYSKESLEKMSPGQRAAIEKLVDDELQRRLAANTLIHSGEDLSEGTTAAGGAMNDLSKKAAMMNVNQRMGLDLLGRDIMLAGQQEVGDPAPEEESFQSILG